VKKDIDSGPIWTAWVQGKALVGRNMKPHTRVTVEPGWTLRTQDTAGTRPANKLPIRWFQRADNSQQELEIPGVRSVDVDYNIDQDSAQLIVQLVNNRLDADYGSSEWENANGDFGRPGYLTPTRGTQTNRWGYFPNEWNGLLTRNALLRTYEGYGGHGKPLAQAIADGNLVLTGVWLVDDTPIKTGQSFELQATNMAKLLVTQYTYPPLVPAGDYPMDRRRFYYPQVITPVVVYGHLATNPLERILKIERDMTSDGYWLVGTDGGVFTYGLAHFYGSIDSIGQTVTPGTYPNEGITGISRTPAGKGYWLVTDEGQIYTFGDAVYHGGLALGPSPAHPIISIECAGPLDGYWLFADDGGVLTYGAATFHGSAAGHLVAGAKVVDAASTITGQGYWIVDDQGHVYAYGDAVYHGGLSTAPAHPICAIAPTPSGAGYYLCGKDGGVFAYGDAVFYGSIPGLSPPITLNDPVSDMIVAVDGTGYWLCAEDGGVFTFRSANSNVQFLGSLPGATADFYPVDGNYLDYTDIIKDLALYAGFYLYDGGATDNVYGTIEATGIYSPDETGGTLDATFFDKLPVHDPMTKIKEVVGYLLYVDDEGALHFHEPNFWASGNFLPDHTPVATIPVIDERTNLSSYQVNTPDKDLRSEIIISTDVPEDGIPGTVTTSIVPATASELRGLIRPAMWVNQVFLDPADQQVMAELIALHIYFKSRLGTVMCIANPMIQIDDQVQIVERETFETNVHYVRRVKRTHDRKSGKYEMELTTNVLSPPGSWAVVKPANSPSGTIVTNRAAV
jgi:hypothetical protein